MKRSVRILGIRGIPANHGGFETFAEQLSEYLVNRKWAVTVYCQEEEGNKVNTDLWHSVSRVHIPVKYSGAIGTVIFDFKSILHASKHNDQVLTLGYNTAIFSIVLRIKGIKNSINMDGIEWKRTKWSFLERIWLYINERIACWLANNLIADHPEIEKHLQSRVSKKKITMIPYGADKITQADASILDIYDLRPHKYFLVIARPEPENSILEIVKAFSAKERKVLLVVLGNFNTISKEYADQVKLYASSEVLFPGAIYDKEVVQALRFYSSLYIHGHTVGGTNPSLVEALGSGTAVLAHDNKYNRWVAGKGARYFKDEQQCEDEIDQLLQTPSLLSEMKNNSTAMYDKYFQKSFVLSRYESLLQNTMD